jgi:hypothetical protein
MIEDETLDDREIGKTVDPDGTTREYRATYERLRRTPPWIPGKGEIPLSMDEATRIAQKWLEDRNPEQKSLRPSRFHLSHFEESPEGPRWVWTVWLGKGGHGPDYAVYILMDGTVLEPIATPPQERMTK